MNDELVLYLFTFSPLVYLWMISFLEIKTNENGEKKVIIGHRKAFNIINFLIVLFYIVVFVSAVYIYIKGVKEVIFSDSVLMYIFNISPDRFALFVCSFIIGSIEFFFIFLLNFNASKSTKYISVLIIQFLILRLNIYIFNLDKYIYNLSKKDYIVGLIILIIYTYITPLIIIQIKNFINKKYNLNAPKEKDLYYYFKIKDLGFMVLCIVNIFYYILGNSNLEIVLLITLVGLIDSYVFKVLKDM